jgi:hypothetical protein
MATQQLSTATMDKARQLATQAHTWTRGRSKVDGSRFCVVPASDGTTAHYANLFGCTCLGYARRGDCSHVESLRIIRRQKDAMTVQQFVCSQCGKAAVGKSRLCPVHLDELADRLGI